MKRMILLNVLLLSIALLFFILDFYVIDYMTRFFVYTPIIILFVEVGVFLFTFRRFKKSSLRVIRKILGIYCINAIIIVSVFEVYSLITEYKFIYYGYTPLLLTLLIYPSILWIMIRLMTLKGMINNRGIIAAITTAFTIVIMSINGLIVGLSANEIKIVNNLNAENTIYITESFLFDSYTNEYTQKNIFFMEYVENIDET